MVPNHVTHHIFCKLFNLTCLYFVSVVRETCVNVNILALVKFAKAHATYILKKTNDQLGSQ